MSENKQNETKVKQFLEEITQIEAVIRESVSSILKKNSVDLNLRAYRAEWHIRGLLYHCGNLIKEYDEFVTGVSARVNSFSDDKPDAIVMYSRSIQNLMYELYALVNLAKITLDSLSKLVYTVFTNKHLPKSVTDFASGTTNCPMYERIANDPILNYLIDLRNCIVHYRTLGSNDNIVVIKDGIDETDLQSAADWFSPMARAIYRINAENNLVVNIFLPDKISERNGRDKKLAKFCYEQRYNIISMAVRFARNITFSTLEAFSYLEKESVQFTYKKEGFEEKVPFLSFSS